MEYRRKPLQHVDLHHIADDGHVTVTNSDGGLTGIQCATVGQAQAWIDELYPNTQRVDTLEEITDIANQRYEAYMACPGQSELTPPHDVLNGMSEDQLFADCVKVGVPVSVAQRYIDGKGSL